MALELTRKIKSIGPEYMLTKDGWEEWIQLRVLNFYLNCWSYRPKLYVVPSPSSPSVNSFAHRRFKHLPQVETEEHREVAEKYLDEVEDMGTILFPNYWNSMLRVLEYIIEPPERTHFPSIPNDCQVWVDYAAKFSIRPRKSQGMYCLDLYVGEEELHREIGGEFKFVSLSIISRHGNYELVKVSYSLGVSSNFDPRCL